MGHQFFLGTGHRWRAFGAQELRYDHSLSLDVTIRISKHCPVICEYVIIIFRETVRPAENTFNNSSRGLQFKNGTVKFLNIINI